MALSQHMSEMTIYDARSLRRLRRNLETLGAHAMISRADAVLRAPSHFVISLSDIEWRRWWMQPCKSVALPLAESVAFLHTRICGFVVLTLTSCREVVGIAVSASAHSFEQPDEATMPLLVLLVLEMCENPQCTAR